MEEIKVALTNTKYTVLSEDPRVTSWNLSICVGFSSLGVLGFPAGVLELQELRLSEICRDMAKTVYVEPENQFVFIGVDPTDTDTSLISYVEQNPTEYTKEFFNRWAETKILYMEFQLYNPLNASYVFVVSGLWCKDKWSFLEVIPTPKINIFTEKA